jgi:hypothetical protein
MLSNAIRAAMTVSAPAVKPTDKSKQRVVESIVLSGGIEVSIQAMTGAQAFIQHMVAELGVKDVSPDAAIRYLWEIRQYLDANTEEMESKFPGSTRMWRQLMFGLAKEFGAYRQQQTQMERAGEKFEYPWQRETVPDKEGAKPERGRSAEMPERQAMAYLDDLLKRLPPVRALYNTDTVADAARRSGLSLAVYVGNIRDMVAEVEAFMSSEQRRMLSGISLKIPGTATGISGPKAYEELTDFIENYRWRLTNLASDLKLRGMLG